LVWVAQMVSFSEKGEGMENLGVGLFVLFILVVCGGRLVFRSTRNKYWGGSWMNELNSDMGCIGHLIN
jgi:hypothetical protein